MALPGLALGLIAGSVLLTWLYNGGRGSLLLPIVWHASFNFVTASEAGRTAAPILTLVVVMAAIVIVLTPDPRRLLP